MTSEYRIIELLKDIKGLILGEGKSDKWMDINDASKYTATSTSTLRRNFHSGDLKGSKRLGKLLFKESDLENWLNG